VVTDAAARRTFGRAVAATSGINVVVTATSAFTGLLLARVLGPETRGEYAAVMAWFGMALVLGELGQSAAITYFVAHDADRARAYVATSRTMMIATGLVTAAVGALLAPTLAQGNHNLTVGYYIAFVTCASAFVGAIYLSALQARHLTRWNIARVLQPIGFLVCTLVIITWDRLSLHAVLLSLAAMVTATAVISYALSARTGLTRGRTDRRVTRPLVRYGLSQLAATSPLAVNSRLDQLVLSQTVAAAQLGRYAVAVTFTTLALPVVAAVGYVAFPRLANSTLSPDRAARLVRLAAVGSGAVALAIVVPLALSAGWLVPWMFGPGYRDAVPLIWILAPGGVFLAVNAVLGDLLRGRNRPLTVAWAQGAGAVVTVAGLALLLPPFGVYGAAAASTTAYTVTCAWMVWALRRHNPAPGTAEAPRDDAAPTRNPAP
jgi:O-antigen/teichoic acid export membrane protein